MNLTESFISGPIIACQNAIDHYTKAINDTQSELEKLLREADNRDQSLTVFRTMRDQWARAKAILEEAK